MFFRNVALHAAGQTLSWNGSVDGGPGRLSTGHDATLPMLEIADVG